MLVAVFDTEHQHHTHSFALLDRASPGDFATSIHCVSEFYNGATRPRKRGGAAAAPARATAAVSLFEASLEILGLTLSEHLDAVALCARDGHSGPLIYDYLIGRVAVIHAIPLIVTWNVKHFFPLFPTLRVATPEKLLQEI